MAHYPMTPRPLRGRAVGGGAASGAASGATAGAAAGAASESPARAEGVAGVGEGAVAVELAPGACLYIPPYWAHAVWSVDASVSLAAFSTSWEQARWVRSSWSAAPLGRFAGTQCSRARGAVIVMAAFLRAVLPHLGAAGPAPLSPRRFVAELYASRFAPLYGAADADRAPDRSELASCLTAAAADGAPELDGRLRSRVDDFARSIAALLTEPDPTWGRSFERGIAAELAADYVEELAGWPGGASDARQLLLLLASSVSRDLEWVQLE